MKWMALILVGLLSVIPHPGYGHNYHCWGWKPEHITDALRDADAVFLGTVIGIEQAQKTRLTLGTSSQKVTFRIQSSWKTIQEIPQSDFATLSQTVTVDDFYRYNFRFNESYLVLAYDLGDGQLHLTGCPRSIHLQDLKPEIYFLPDPLYSTEGDLDALLTQLHEEQHSTIIATTSEESDYPDAENVNTTQDEPNDLTIHDDNEPNEPTALPGDDEEELTIEPVMDEQAIKDTTSQSDHPPHNNSTTEPAELTQPLKPRPAQPFPDADTSPLMMYHTVDQEHSPMKKQLVDDLNPTLPDEETLSLPEENAIISDVGIEPDMEKDKKSEELPLLPDF